jgi:iron-sulfur cluster repair protein YtfE (RIC family)
MDPLARTSHEHHDRLIDHVDRLAALAAELDRGVTPAFMDACEAEHRFILEQLVPHMEAIETTLYGELDRLMEGRHSMAPMRREHAELRRLIESTGQYHEAVTSGRLGPAEAMGLRRALYRLHALLRVHLAEEELYLRVLEGNLGDAEKEELARGIQHAAAEPL